MIHVIFLNQGFLQIFAQEWNYRTVVTIFSFLRNLHTVLYRGCANVHSHQQCGNVAFFPTPSPAFICRLFNDGHSDWCEMISHCGADLHFSSNEWLSIPARRASRGSAVENPPQDRSHSRHGFDPCEWRILGRRAWQPPPVFLPGEAHGWEARWATVHGMAMSRT